MVAMESLALILPALELGFSTVAPLTFRKRFFTGRGGWLPVLSILTCPYLFIGLCQVLVGTLGIYNCGMWIWFLNQEVNLGPWIGSMES